MMDDYKELITDIAGAMLMAKVMGRDSMAKVYSRAANAIEQLVKERDEWMEYAKQERKRSIERSHELAVELDRVKKERDAAVADIEEVIHEEFGDICTICTKYKSCMKIAAKTPLAQPPCERGKWRGLVGVHR